MWLPLTDVSFHRNISQDDGQQGRRPESAEDSGAEGGSEGTPESAALGGPRQGGGRSTETERCAVVTDALVPEQQEGEGPSTPSQSDSYLLHSSPVVFTTGVKKHRRPSSFTSVDSDCK